ncbi:MAG: chromosomal replication initiation protein DnaA [Deltaproteobacteria bacterium GWB2_65_81]|nr:MAG: chromosomal replication initiation protein DnaA [Deltaproteobacteria bacterium GWA2_65_63]OGP28555.1 MAG: chromosomal replication initiation protein DnaA [Deltaproteobacteria bacterium GWB2_65_81]OGP37108.1 MAG: chromosomal replication initiation protein DnaA [Deltaproteobacteria bacterium GWC2_66_88]
MLAQLRGEVSEQVFETWLRPLRYVTREGPVLFVATPHKFFKQWIEDNHLARIEEIARKELAEEVTVEIMVGSEEEEPPSPGSVSSRLMLPEETATRARTVFGLLNNRYTFDRFVIGTGNQFAHAASVAVANDPGNSYNPLFIYGGVGLGKTHLLHAIGNAALEKSPRLMVCYIPAEKFTNDLIASLRSGKMSDFKERYRNVDLLLMDDVQFIAGKRSTQEEFFHTFNELYSTRRQVVVTSDKFPKEIPDLEERIQSRFEWGLVADIQAPDIETRVAILNRKAELENITLPEDVALFLATAVKNNIRELEGCLIRIGAHASLTRKEINLDLAKAILAPILGNAGREISPDMIQKAVADHFGVKLSELRSDRKHKVIAMPRQVAMYLMREMTRCSFPDIGQRFGGRDHTTVMYAVKKIEKNLADDVSLRNTVDTLRKKIEG